MSESRSWCDFRTVAGSLVCGLEKCRLNETGKFIE